MSACTLPLLLAFTALAADPAASDKAVAAAVRAGKPVAAADRPLAEAVRRIDATGGQVEFDARGRLVGVDLAGDRVSATNANVAVLASLPRLRRVRLSGGEITSAGLDSAFVLSAT